ncbi:hypothetical protein RND71_032031 [Anisodus tanguticus]|uniref:NADH:quinone oxidoreductase/Mrp antiporter transmembrane domain-containing protein n=1 Tax=Anisodus tanguticus TaxID=243964 RepID=A0AAE1RCF0_9SOLA|nr:hypothetical protein RND71_032031 [Anisodus tanguticus]
MVGGGAALPFDRYTVEKADHERYRCASDPDKTAIKAMLVNRVGSHTWSPDAMKGPSPVSALIHAATMVTTGVFMIARGSPLFEYPPTALIVITFAGAMTSFLAATTGIL